LAESYYIGADLGKKQDYSVIAVVRRDVGAVLRLVHMKRFKLGTPYASVIGYLKVLSDRLSRVERILIDQTGVGEAVVEEAQKNIPHAEGIVLTLPAKTDVLQYLKLTMNDGRFLCPTTATSSPS